MTTLTNNPNFDKRTRTVVAKLEEQTDQLLEEGNEAKLATHLAGLVAWEESLRSAITQNDEQLKDARADLPPDDSFLIALTGLDRNFQATLPAARTLRRRVEGQLQTVTVN